MITQKYLKLGRNLKRLLLERRVRPFDFAGEINLPKTRVHRLVRSKPSRLCNSSLKPTADFFSVSVEDLLQEILDLDSIWNLNLNDDKNCPSIATKVPLISWQNMEHINHKNKTGNKHIITLSQLSKYSFASIMPDSSMEPLFMEGSVLIFDPIQPPGDRSYIISKLQKENMFIFRQLLVDGKDRYLKPLNPNTNLFNMRLLNQEDEIIATLIEVRNQCISSNEDINQFKK